LKGRVNDGIAADMQRNFVTTEVHSTGDKVYVKAHRLIQMICTPNRFLTPMKRTNTNNRRHEDPAFVPVSWDQMPDAVAAEARTTHDEGLPETGAKLVCL